MIRRRLNLPGARAIYLWDLLTELVARELKVRYKRSALGFTWSLLNPLAQLLVFSVVFRWVLRLDIPNYAAFLFSGLLAWNWFQASLVQATDAIVGNRELVRRPGFPVALLPVITVAGQLVHFVLALPVLIVFLLLSGIHLTPVLLLLPLVMAIQFLLTLSMAYLLATAHVSLRDMQYLVGIVLMLGFYLTPVFYDPAAVPARYQAVYGLNPMTRLIAAYRAILIAGRPPDAAALLGLALVGGALLVVGYRVFTHASYQFAEEL